MSLVVEEMPSLRMAAMPHVGPYNRIFEAFERLTAIAGPAGLLQNEAILVAAYYDDPERTPPSRLRSAAGIMVPDDLRLPPGTAEIRLAGGRYARATHVGPYAMLADAWWRMMREWVPGSGNRIAGGACYEIYRNNPSNTRPEELLTDLYVPIS